MKVGTTTGLAFRALLRNKTRSLLTTLGIVIGVAAVVLMQAMGQVATAYVGETIAALGTNVMMIVPGASTSSRGMSPLSAGAPLFTPGDLDVIRREARDVATITPVTTRPLRVVVGASNRTTAVSGVSPEYFEIRGWAAARGRLLTAEDDREGALVCVIGRTVSDELFAGHDPIGGELRVHDLACPVVGVLEPKGASAFGTDQDDLVLVPWSAFARRIAGAERFGMLMASAITADRMDAARDQVIAILRRRRHILDDEIEDFSVRDPREMQAVLTNVMQVLTALLAGVAAVSLLVGGIGIMNIMLVSVTERTREIGIRLAVGARGYDILTQFLVESVVLSIAGGAVGVLAGVLGGIVVASLLDIPFVLPVAALPLAFGVSVLVGVVFGVFPARKAARLSPLAALRFE